MISYILTFGFGYCFHRYKCDDLMHLTRHLTARCDTLLHYVISLTSSPLDDYIEECKQMRQVEERHKLVMIELCNQQRKDIEPVQTDTGWWFW